MGDNVWVLELVGGCLFGVNNAVRDEATSKLQEECCIQRNTGSKNEKGR